AWRGRASGRGRRWRRLPRPGRGWVPASSGDPRGQLDPEAAAPSRFAFDAEGACHPLDGLLADRQPDAGSGVGGRRIQPLEDLEHPFVVLRSDPESVVVDQDPDGILALLGAHAYFG